MSDPDNGVASGSGRAGSGVGLKVLVGARVAFRFWSVPGLELAQGSGAGVGSGLALGSEFSRFSRKASPNPSPLGRALGEGTFGFCSSALMSLVSGFAATT